MYDEGVVEVQEERHEFIPAQRTDVHLAREKCKRPLETCRTIDGHYRFGWQSVGCCSMERGPTKEGSRKDADGRDACKLQQMIVMHQVVAAAVVAAA